MIEDNSLDWHIARLFELSLRECDVADLAEKAYESISAAMEKIKTSDNRLDADDDAMDAGERRQYDHNVLVNDKISALLDVANMSLAAAAGLAFEYELINDGIRELSRGVSFMLRQRVEAASFDRQREHNFRRDCRLFRDDDCASSDGAA